MSIVYFILILLLLVIVHEFGHFQMAKWFKMQVDEFAFGFPPKAFSFIHRKTKFSFNILPIGGYVRIKGEDGEDTSSGSFGSKSYLARILVLIAGILMNVLIAYFLFFGAVSLGLPRLTESGGTEAKVLVFSVLEGSPAQQAGLLPGDILDSVSYERHELKIDSTSVVTSAASTGQTLKIEITRRVDGTDKNLELTVKPEKVDGINQIGVSIETVEFGKLPFLKAVVNAGQNTYAYTIETVKGFAQLFGKLFSGISVGNQVSGPVGIVKQVGEISKFGLANILFFAGILSINLAVLNLVPFPGLDGGRILFVLVEAISRKKVPQKVFGILNLIGIIILLGLMVLITVKDILHF